jgi:gluconate 5-dehydrogenase
MNSPHPFGLSGQIALVTGAGRGLGLEVAKALAAAGALVLLNGRRAEALNSAVAAIEASGGRARAAAFDVTDADAVERSFADILAQHGRLDVLVNNVGRRDRRALFDFPLEDVRTLLEVDLVAPFQLSREAAKLMIAAKSGRIINITSIAGPLAGPGDTPYTVAKGGLEALTRALAAELGVHGITVNAIAPGFFATEANAELVAQTSVASWLRQRTSLGRWGEPKEIAGAAVFLASPAASYITGQILAVDGGYLAHF